MGTTRPLHLQMEPVRLESAGTHSPSQCKAGARASWTVGGGGVDLQQEAQGSAHSWLPFTPASAQGGAHGWLPRWPEPIMVSGSLRSVPKAPEGESHT